MAIVTLEEKEVGNEMIALQEEDLTDGSKTYRIRVKWLKWSGTERMVVVECRDREVADKLFKMFIGDEVTEIWGY